MIIKKYNTVGTFPKSNRKITGTDAKTIHLTHMYIITDFHCLIQ